MNAIRDITGRQIDLPPVRGPWTAALYRLLGRPAWDAAPLQEIAPVEDPLSDDDLQMALYLCYELHYSAVEGIDDRMEWSPVVLMFRAALERQFESALCNLVPHLDLRTASVGDELQLLVEEDAGPPLSRYVETQATIEQFLEHVVHRSAYQLKEADPHSWAIPRLTGRPKAALVEIQADEYGGGRPDRIHATLFENTMRGLGLNEEYGTYLERIPGVTLATVNLMSWCGLHRRLRGAIVGHLALFEMTSSIPNRRYANGARRLGFGVEVTDFYDEHVEADAVHESIAAWDLANALACSQPDLVPSILFGAKSLLALETRWAQHLLSRWECGDTSLISRFDRC